jgi:hypothetical protein
MNEAELNECRCNPCPSGCDCGCGNTVEQQACACGPQCACAGNCTPADAG